MDGAQAVSDAHGPLRHVLCCFPDEAARRPGYRVVFADLFRKLPATTRITVVAHATVLDDLAEVLADAGVGERACVVAAPEAMRFTVWAQDPFVVVRDGATTRLVQPGLFEPEGDDRVAPLVARHCGMQVERSVLRFHGGHVLVGDDFALVSRECLAATAASTGADEDAIAAQFGALVGGGRRVVFVGTDLPVPKETIRPLPGGRLEVVHQAAGARLPLVHLDLFVSLAGRGPSGRYRLLVGSPDAANAVLGVPPLDHSLGALFDDVAAQLGDEGFDVIRNPLPLTYGDGRRAVEGTVRDVRLWYFATSNNCLVQIDPDEGDHVWLPTYGHRGWPELAATDEANRRIWAELGFTTHEVADLHPFAQRLGALHCITKFVER